MNRAAGDGGHLWGEECSGSSSSNLVRGRIKAGRRPQVYISHSLSSLAAREDDEVHFDTSDADNSNVLVAGRHYPSIQEFASAIPNHLLLGSLLEHLCFIYESNPARSRTLFKVIGQQLAAMNVLSPLAISDEFSTVRLQHNRAFTELLNAASSTLYSQGQPCLSNSQNSSIKPKEGLVQAQASRYLSEFEEVSRLGRGSYGNVCKVMNKLDGQYYAMKKILIKKVSKEDCMRVLREVKLLSSLQHVHVVGYHTAWMEHVQPAAYAESRLPALESLESDCSDESFDISSASSSIVFQSLSQPQTDAAQSANVPQREAHPITALVSAQRGQVVCPKTMRRIPENYIPCVFLGQKKPKQANKCPVVDWDTSLLEESSSRSSVELNNNSYIDKGCQKQVDKCLKKPTREVQFHLMLYIQMQLCERSLKDWIAERNAKPKESPTDPYDCVDPEHTFNLLKHILEGVEYIHSKGIMHRDLKPRNIFLHDRDSQVRIGDFGLACKDIILESLKAGPSPGSDYMHTTGVGTFVYAAPEQLNGSKYNSKSDMYSIGVLALELFQPFGTEMERIRTLGDLREGKIAASFQDRWPVLAKYIVQLLSKDPSVRPTASQLLESELFCNKDSVIHDLRRKVEEQEEEIMELRRQISELHSSHVPHQLSKRGDS